MTRNIAIVTGASSGMGREFVLQIAAKYGKLDEIWAIARREELLWQLQGEAALPVRILTMDLAQEESIKRLMALLATENPRIQMCIRDSGITSQGTTDALEKSGTIEHLAPVTLEGNTHYYLMLAGDETIYDFPVAEFPQIIRFREGDFISFGF